MSLCFIYANDIYALSSKIRRPRMLRQELLSMMNKNNMSTKPLMYTWQNVRGNNRLRFSQDEVEWFSSCFLLNEIIYCRWYGFKSLPRRIVIAILATQLNTIKKVNIFFTTATAPYVLCTESHCLFLSRLLASCKQLSSADTQQLFLVGMVDCLARVAAVVGE